jgi:predicted dehydrogenase
MAVIGVGHLGKEHARILASHPEVELVGVADVNYEQAQGVALRCQCQAYADYWPLLNLVDAATLVVPTTHHHAIAREFLRRGIPLLVEKPLTASLEQADQLVELANRHGAVLQVGHIERFNPAFEELVTRPLQPKLIECERLGPYTGRSTDIGVVLDLMIHDLDLLLALGLGQPRSVDALGASVFGGHEDVANARISFAGGCVANLTASRVSGSPSRKMRAWAPEGYASLDFAKRTLTFIQPSADLRAGKLDVMRMEARDRLRIKDEMFERHLQVLKLERKEGDALTRELSEFVQCVNHGSRPRVSGEAARNALEVASRVLDQIRTHPWEGRVDGPVGPHRLPAPLGTLFRAAEGGAAA